MTPGNALHHVNVCWAVLHGLGGSLDAPAATGLHDSGVNHCRLLFGQ